MLESLLSGNSQKTVVPGVLNGIYEAQPIITSMDYNYYNLGGAYVRVGDYLYIFPGSQSSGGSYVLVSSAYRYNLKTFKVESLRNAPKAVSYGSVCYSNGKIYFVAGLPANGVNTAPLCIYDIETNLWENTTKFNYLRKNCRTFVYKDRLYMVGGGLSSGGVYYEVRSISLTDYTEIAHGNFLDKSGAGYLQNEGQGVLIGSKFYFSRGGNVSSNAWMVFDAEKLSLTVLSPNPESIGGESPVLLGNKIGIRNGNKSFSLYDPTTDKWTVIPVESNTSNSGNGQSAHFEYDGSPWTKYFQSNDTTAKRFWRIY